MIEDHVAMRKLFRFGTDRRGAAGTGGRPIVGWRLVGVEVPLLWGTRDVVRGAAGVLAGGEYGGTASGNGLTEW